MTKTNPPCTALTQRPSRLKGARSWTPANVVSAVTALVLLGLVLPATPAAAFVCSNAAGAQSGNDNGDTLSTACGQNSNATGSVSTAVGASSVASGDFSTALGSQARATGLGSTATGEGSTANAAGSAAFGISSNAINTGSTAIGGAIVNSSGPGSIGINGGARASGQFSTAVGAASTASGAGSIAMGAMQAAVPFDAVNNRGAVAAGSNSIAIGTNSSTAVGATSAVALGTGATANALQAVAVGQATAGGTAAVAIGQATASGNLSIAVGLQASATQTNSVAIGTNATATRANQMALGTNVSTYTLAGVTSAQSLAAQSGPTSFVTTDADGNLAVSGFSPASFTALDNRVTNLQNQVNNMQNQIIANDRKANGGIAAAAALGGLVQAVTPGKSVVTGGYGIWGGQSALAFGLSHRFQNNWTVKGAAAFAASSGGAGGSISAGYEF